MMRRTRINVRIIDLHCGALSQVGSELDTPREPAKRMITGCRFTSSIRRKRIAQSTNKSLVHHGLDVIARLRFIYLIIRIVRIISIVEAKIILLILIVRINRVRQIARLGIPLVIMVLQSFSANPFEVTVFPGVMTITFLSTPCCCFG